MSDRFDALMVELSQELSSIPPAEGDRLIRMSSVERGDRLEVLCDRLASRCADLTMTLALLEQEQIVEGRRPGIWACPRCGIESTMRHAIHHTDQCPFSLLVSLDETPDLPEPRVGAAGCVR